VITLVGTGHVFRIAEPVAFIVKNIWPDAVLVELDPSRYEAIVSSEQRKRTDLPKSHRNLAEYQKRMAEEYGSKAGAEFVAAVETGRTIGAAIEFIDKDAKQTMEELRDEMPFFERMRLSFSSFGDRFRSKKKADNAINNFMENEDEVMTNMRKKYPTLVRKLIDERDVHMAEKIKEASARYENIVVIVGDGHIEGIAKLLDNGNITKIRLKTLMDTKLMNSLRTELWSGKAGGTDKEGTE
jgi:pheromone shutdown protein TraB